MEDNKIQVNTRIKVMTENHGQEKKEQMSSSVSEKERQQFDLLPGNNSLLTRGLFVPTGLRRVHLKDILQHLRDVCPVARIGFKFRNSGCELKCSLSESKMQDITILIN